MIATSPPCSGVASPSRGITHAWPRTSDSTVSGAWSLISKDHGGSMIERSTKAFRARGPSSSPATASIGSA